MKRILHFSILLLTALTVLATDRVTITLTITNNPVAANTFVVNAATKTWRASPTVPATEITIGANIGASATNLFRQLSAYQLAGPVTLGFLSSNVVTIKGAIGEAMSASISAGYGVLSYSTNTDTAMVWVRVPFSSETAVPQTNNPTQLAVGMGTYSQSPFAAGTTLLQYILQTSGNQVASGTKTFAGIIIPSGEIVSNAVPVLEWWDSAGPANKKRAQWIMDGGTFYANFRTDAGADIIDAMRITESVIEFNVPIHPLGNLMDTVTLTNATVTASTLNGTNYSTGIFGHTRANNTSLANGNNATIDFGTKVFVKIKAGPTAAFAICGIAGGADGREIELYNATGQNMTISNDSGVEPTAANRIYTQTGGDRATTGNGYVTLRYDTEDSRWVIKSFEP